MRELAERFGVSVRTVFRDLKALDDIGIPIVSEAGGYRILEIFRLRPMRFTPAEVLTPMAALDFARRRRVLGGEAAASAMEKLAAVLPGPKQELAAGLDSLLVVDPVPAHSEFPPEEGRRFTRSSVPSASSKTLAQSCRGVDGSGACEDKRDREHGPSVSKGTVPSGREDARTRGTDDDYEHRQCCCEICFCSGSGVASRGKQERN